MHRMKAKAAAVVLATSLLSGCGAAAVKPSATPAPTEVTAPSAILTQAPTPTKNPLDEINVSREEKLAIFKEIDAILNAPENDYIYTTKTGDEVREFENSVMQQVADAHGISFDEADKIYLYISLGYYPTEDPAKYTVRYGEILDAKIVVTTLIIKVKINSQLSNKLTIDQNYYNVEDIIRNQGGDQFEEISYWAVADMQSGDESKVMAFDVDSALIQKIKNQTVLPNEMGDYVQNLWVLPSLLN